jgi:hypothetical protein
LFITLICIQGGVEMIITAESNRTIKAPRRKLKLQAIDFEINLGSSMTGEGS